ncbi:MAG: WD40 repeat domain-containing serine/threonine protein kinase [Verrucomicrobiota bacterium]
MSPSDPHDGIPVIPDHQLVEVIGSGAYGTVWLGRTVLGTARAIKLIRRSSFESEQPFHREFDGIRRYEPVSRRCPSLVPILQVGRDDAAGFFYAVMELADAVDGPGGVGSPGEGALGYLARTLRTDLGQRGRLPIAECVEVGLAMADALETLHGAGLVHRDIKPSNIIRLRGRACLADVGLVSEAREGSSLVGTTGYIAPEGPGLPQADLYSLGMVLYEISTGMRLAEFPGTPAEWLQPGHAIEWEFHEIVLRLGARDPARRHRDAREVRDELLLLRGGRSVRRLRARERRQRLLLRTTALLAVLGLVAGIVAAVRHDRARDEAARQAENRSQRVDLLVSRARDALNDVAPAARSRALVTLREALALEPGRPEVRDLVAAALLVPEIVPEKAPWRPPLGRPLDVPRRWPVGRLASATGLFDPDLRRLFRPGPDGWLEALPVRSGAAPEAIPPPSPGFGLEFISSVSLDGRWLLVRDAAERFQVVSRTDGRSRLSFRLDPKYLGREFTPDGRWLLAGRADHAFDLLPIGHPGPARRVPVGVPPHDLVVSPDGLWVAVINATNPVVRFASLERARVERHLELPPGESVQVLAWNPEGDLLQVASEMQVFVARFDRPAAPVKRLVKEDHGLLGLAVSPDSAWTLTTGYNGRSRVWDWSSETVLAEHAAAGAAVQWSPDGRWIAWRDDAQWELLRFDPPTGWSVLPALPPTLPTETNAGPAVVRFHPAGDRWASGSYDGVRLYPRSGRGRAAFWPCDDRMIQHLAFSPDGTRIWALGFTNLFSFAVEGDPDRPGLRLLGTRRLPGPGRGAVTSSGRVWLVSTNGSFLGPDPGGPSGATDGADWVPVDLPPRSVIGSVDPSGRGHLGSWGLDAPPAVIRPADGFPVTRLEMPRDPSEVGEAGELVLCPVSSRVFGAATHGVVAWDRDSGRLLWRRVLDPVGVYGRLAVTPDGRRLAVALGTRSIHLLEAQDGSTVSQVRMPERLRLTSLAWDPRGRRLVAGTVVHAAHLWDFDALGSALAAEGVAVPDLLEPALPTASGGVATAAD